MVQPVDARSRTSPKPAPITISFHPEASDHVDRTMQLIHDDGCPGGR